MGILYDIIHALEEAREDKAKRETAQRLVDGFRGRVRDDLVSDYFERRLQERHPDWDKGSGN